MAFPTGFARVRVGFYSHQHFFHIYGGIQSILVKSTSVHEAGRGVNTSGVRIRNREMLEEEHQHLGGNPEKKTVKIIKDWKL